MAYNFLIVDDSAFVRTVFKKTLSLANLEVAAVFEAGNGAEALELLGRQQVDLIFLDVNMPVMDGLEFMDRLRSQQQFVHIPVIVLSTEGSRERKALLADKDVVACLRKPFTTEQVREAIEAALEQRP